MMGKRKMPRYRKRLPVRFGEDKPERLGYTEDLAEAGLFIRAAMVPAPGTLLSIELTAPDGQGIHLEGRVQWAKKVPGNILHKMKKAGMGVVITRFIAGRELYSELLCPSAGR